MERLIRVGSLVCVSGILGAALRRLQKVFFGYGFRDGGKALARIRRRDSASGVTGGPVRQEWMRVTACRRLIGNLRELHSPNPRDGPWSPNGMILTHHVESSD